MEKQIFLAAITQDFSVKRFFSNHSNMLIWCLGSISYQR